MISDHALVRFTLSVKKSPLGVEWITRRAWSQLSPDLFASDLVASKLCNDLDVLNDLSVDDLANVYCDVLTDLLDRHWR